MRLCIPVIENKGLDSNLSQHVGSAEGFIILNTEDKSLDYKENSNKHHAHGMCMPVNAIGAENFDAFVVQGIGRRAYSLLKEQGIKLYKSNGDKVKDILNSFDDSSLIELSDNECCSGHGHHNHGHNH